MKDLLTITEASIWASQYTKKEVTNSNISYLIQYGRVAKKTQQGKTFVSRQELEKYYESYLGKREVDWKKELGDDLNWHLSFDYLKESDTTKHVHRLHPYKGKFIPQLVAYFLDEHTDEFKKEVFFQPEDIIYDPFCGSGTTLIQANELGMHAIGSDVSAFNTLISNVKVGKYNLAKLKIAMDGITQKLTQFVHDKGHLRFDQALLDMLTKVNNHYFPSPDFKIWVRRKEIDEKAYTKAKVEEVLPKYHELVRAHSISLEQPDTGHEFLDRWYLPPVRQEIDLLFSLVKEIEDVATKKVLSLVLSRTIRSCRATTHADLATLKDAIKEVYYCRKHGKICKPLFTSLTWWRRYCKDTLKRLSQFSKLRTETQQVCLTGDSRQIDLLGALSHKKPNFAQHVKEKKISGIFSSPPYVGLIDYHEQHAYAYDLFGFERNDEQEIGPLFRGKGAAARKSYAEGIAAVLTNAKHFMVKDYNVFLVANDKFGMYPEIARAAGMQIVNQYKRPVLNRTEKDKNAYSEIIFHLKSL